MGIPNRPAKRAPPSPLRANPIVCKAERIRLVKREAGSISSGRRSANTFLGQATLRQKNLRTVKSQADRSSCTRQISRLAAIVAMNSLRGDRTQWTQRAGAGRGHTNQQFFGGLAH